MILYYLATVVGASFMLMSSVVLGRYLYYSIYLRAPSEAPSVQLVFTLYLVGHALFLLRRYLITDVAHRINEAGENGQARIISATPLGSPDEARDRYWYTLTMDVQPGEGRPTAFSTSVTQLFGSRALPKLTPGSVLPIKYSYKHKQALVVCEDALLSIRR